jgi:hypothetical protein
LGGGEAEIASVGLSLVERKEVLVQPYEHGETLLRRGCRYIGSFGSGQDEKRGGKLPTEGWRGRLSLGGKRCSMAKPQAGGAQC